MHIRMEYFDILNIFNEITLTSFLLLSSVADVCTTSFC